MATFLFLIVVFQLIDIPIMILVSMVCMIITYQATIGSYYFVYVSQVATETQNSVAVFTLWLMVFIFSLITGNMINGIGIVGTFSLFGAITLFGGVYFIYTMRSTKGL